MTNHTILCRKEFISGKSATTVDPLALEFNIKTILDAKSVQFSWWTLDKIYITTEDAYTGTFTFTVDVDDGTNEVDRAKVSESIAGESDIEISDIGLDARVRDVLKIISSANLTIGFIHVFITILVGV